MTTHLLSVGHRLSGLDIVVQLSAAAPGLGPDFLEAVPALRGVLVLSTCSRLIPLIDADSWVDTGCPATPHPDLRSAGANQSITTSDLGETITAFPAEHVELPASDLLSAHLVGAAARREVFTIAVSLSSAVVDEAQIVGQIRHVAEIAAAEGMLSPELVQVVEHALATARRVAHETELSGQGCSVVAVDVDRTAGRLSPLEDCRALVVGIGSYAGVTVVSLRTRGLTDIAIYPTFNHAKVFAAGHSLRAVPTGTLSKAMSRADPVVTCRGIGGPILTADVATSVAAECTDLAGGASRPLVILDLALTRGANEAIDALPDAVHLDPARVRDAVPDAEAQQVTTTCAIAEAETIDFECTPAGRVMDPLITALRAQVGRVVTEEAARLRPQPTCRLALAVSAVNGRTRVGVSGVSSTDAVVGAYPHHHFAADPGFGAASEIDGEFMVPLAQTEWTLYHPAAHPLHQPTAMARRADQEGCEETYRQTLELVWGLESTGENHG